MRGSAVHATDGSSTAQYVKGGRKRTVPLTHPQGPTPHSTALRLDSERAVNMLCVLPPALNLRTRVPSADDQ